MKQEKKLSSKENNDNMNYIKVQLDIKIWPWVNKVYSGVQLGDGLIKILFFHTFPLAKTGL